MRGMLYPTPTPHASATHVQLKELAKFDMNVYMKIFFSFSEQFWPSNEFHLYVDDKRGYYPLWQNMNHPKYFGAGPPYVFMVTVVDYEAKRIERQNQTEVIAEAMAVLKTMFNNNSLPDPLEVFPVTPPTPPSPPNPASD